MRNDLHGFAEIIAAPLFQDHRLINLAASEVVVPRKDAVSKALVMAEVEIGLCAVIQHVNFAMLEWVHCSRIDIQIWVELLENNAQASRFK